MDQLIKATAEYLRFELRQAKDVTLFRTPGNIGDQLIHAGAKAMLSRLQVRYRQLHLSEASTSDGDIALIDGSGGWCLPHHMMPECIAPIEARYRRVIILPSSFDLQEPSVDQWIRSTRSLVMARENVSYRTIGRHCQAMLAADTAFFFDYSPFIRKGVGVLDAFRTDAESRFDRLPPLNIDISLTCSSLDEWLETISRYESVRTDRCHVMIAAAMMGKYVQAWPSSYHKVQGIAETMQLRVDLMQGEP